MDRINWTYKNKSSFKSEMRVLKSVVTSHITKSIVTGDTEHTFTSESVSKDVGYTDRYTMTAIRQLCDREFVVCLNDDENRKVQRIFKLTKSGYNWYLDNLDYAEQEAK